MEMVAKGGRKGVGGILARRETYRDVENGGPLTLDAGWDRCSFGDCTAGG